MPTCMAAHRLPWGQVHLYCCSSGLSSWSGWLSGLVHAQDASSSADDAAVDTLTALRAFPAHPNLRQHVAAMLRHE